MQTQAMKVHLITGRGSTGYMIRSICKGDIADVALAA